MQPWDKARTCKIPIEQEATEKTELISLLALFAPVHIPARRDCPKASPLLVSRMKKGRSGRESATAGDRSPAAELPAQHQPVPADGRCRASLERDSRLTGDGPRMPVFLSKSTKNGGRSCRSLLRQSLGILKQLFNLVEVGTKLFVIWFQLHAFPKMS